MTARERLKTAFWTVVWTAMIFFVIWCVARFTMQLSPTDATAHYEAENAKLQREIDSLKMEFLSLQMMFSQQITVIDSLECELEDNAVEINKINIKHEKNTLHINSLPVDSLFRFFTEYLEQRYRLF